MTAQSKSYKIVAGPSDLDLAMALVARKLRMTLEITVVVEGKKFKLQITVQELADNGPTDWIMGGVIDSLQRPVHRITHELDSMIRDARENGPFYRAFYSTQDRRGFLAFAKTRMIPHHSGIFRIPNFTPESNEKRLPEEWRSDIGYKIGNHRPGWPLVGGYGGPDTWDEPCTLAEFYQHLAECDDVVLMGVGTSKD